MQAQHIITVTQLLIQLIQTQYTYIETTTTQNSHEEINALNTIKRQIDNLRNEQKRVEDILFQVVVYEGRRWQTVQKTIDTVNEQMNSIKKYPEQMYQAHIKLKDQLTVVIDEIKRYVEHVIINGVTSIRTDMYDYSKIELSYNQRKLQNIQVSIEQVRRKISKQDSKRRRCKK